MLSPTRSRSRMLSILLMVCLVLPAITGFGVQGVTAQGQETPVTLASYELIGTTSIPTGTQFEETEVGGLSSITYHPDRDVYYALSDDPGNIDPVRYYTLSIDLSDERLDDGDISFLEVTTIRNEAGEPYAPGSLDPEGFVLARRHSFYLSSEGLAAASPPAEPFIKRLNRNGRASRTMIIPDKFLPDGMVTKGVRPNLGFESLGITPDKRTLVTASEGALAQDGPTANLDQESFARILQYQLGYKKPREEFVYVGNPVAEAPVPADQFRVNGLVELLPLDNAGTMLALERSFSVGAEGGGNTVWLYEISTQGATDVSGYESLYPNGVDQPPVEFEPVTKRLILNVEEDLGIEPDNIEGMTFGPPLPDGRVPLVLVSDNNFAATQSTQFIVLAVELTEVPTE